MDFTNLDDTNSILVYIILLENILYYECHQSHALHLLLLPGTKGQHVWVTGKPRRISGVGVQTRKVIQWIEC